MKQVLLRSFRVNNQVIQVNGDKRTTAVKNHVLSSLERFWCIAHAKRHILELIGSEFRLKCCAIHMLWKNPNLINTLLKVHFDKDFRALEAIQQFINSWEGVLVRLGNLIQGSVINTKA